ncbi:MAG: low molecular weight protein-tyrosine-phosphatase [Campylobacterota bacterium]
MSKIDSIIFVCLGNICRSPIAEAIAQKYVKQNDLHIEVASAGTGNWHEGEPPCENSIKVCIQNGLDIAHQRASQIKKEDLDKYDVIVGLDDSNIANLKKLGAKNVLKLGDFGYEGKDVPDPYFFEGFLGFDKVYEMINICVLNLMNEKC